MTKERTQEEMNQLLEEEKSLQKERQYLQLFSEEYRRATVSSQNLVTEVLTILNSSEEQSYYQHWLDRHQAFTKKIRGSLYERESNLIYRAHRLQEDVATMRKESR